MVKTLRTRVSFLAILLFGSFALAHAPRLDDGATSSDLAELAPLIHARTPEPIMSVKKLANGRIEVTTGHAHGDYGSGHEFTLKKAKGKWRIVKELAWMA